MVDIALAPKSNQYGVQKEEPSATQYSAQRSSAAAHLPPDCDQSQIRLHLPPFKRELFRGPAGYLSCLTTTCADW
jgi:hypothetical protein